MSDHLHTSHMAEHLIGSEIIKLAGEINARIREGQKIYNLTIGDFNSNLFPIPDLLKEGIKTAYDNNETNYPPGEGILELRQEISRYISTRGNLEYHADEVIVAGGSRPLIYAIYKSLLDHKDTVLYPVPSWNNNHYVHLTGCKGIEIETSPENNFLPVAKDLKKHLSKATLLALCSPLNPTGTCFSKKDLTAICKAVVKENEKRKKKDKKALYIMYDQIYWGLNYKGVKHVDPVSLCPELREYTIYIHGISKVFSATGVRVGWAWGPSKIINKMKSVLGHVGAWAPKAEQKATAQFLANDKAISAYLKWENTEINKRLEGFYNGFQSLKSKGLAIDALQPQGAIYLTVLIDILDKKTPEGHTLKSISDVTEYLLNRAHVAMVPFSAFGSHTDKPWYRLSVGTCSMDDVHEIIKHLDKALTNLK